uniref:ADP-ribose pyrophosphatase YjhB, NUDIX family n=1 Tax=Candidatus Kentrum sp. LFY TaxID=2126342 RepID=A0A450WYY2_9GAMM|nr:MAG: ADP-ribose pyrophosphatase YjhB, NUDIX family [Candidatus Kentron sp. LFY]
MISKTEPTYDSDLARWADLLRDISARGLCYSKDPHDIENFHRIQAIAREMLASSTGEIDGCGQQMPWVEMLFRRPTPVIYGDGALIDGNGAVLLVQRADNHTWLLPGGALEVGENAARGVCREVREETGITCTPTSLVGVFDEPCGVACFPYHMYILTFLCRTEDLDTSDFVLPPHEISAAGWFEEDALPDALYPGVSLRIREAFKSWRGEQSAYFDGV